MIFPAIYSIIINRLYTKEYDSIIENVTIANRINSIAKHDIPNELWIIVSGRKVFDDGKQYSMMDEINSGIDSMMKSERRSPGSQ